MRLLLIGSGAREHAIAKTIHRSPQQHSLCCFASHHNPGIMLLTTAYQVGDSRNAQQIIHFAQQQHIDLAIIGPEAPLEQGISDALWQQQIPTIGPKRQLAKIESSKQFARDLLQHYHINASPAYRAFHSMSGVKSWLQQWSQQYVIKADGLMGGKGVKVFGDHLSNDQQALDWCQQLTDQGHAFVIEQKLEGEEFSLISFSDGEHLVHMPPVQDHKRAFVNDQGANTGGMGSYSDANHSLPFLTKENIQQAQAINEATVAALKKHSGQAYIGFLYGGFMATADGVKLIEYNARLGDPEAINLLSILETDIIEIFQAMVTTTLNQLNVRFATKATVCKYAVPEGYPDDAVKNQVVTIRNPDIQQALFFAAIEERAGKLYQTGSRTIASLGIGDTIAIAETIAEQQLMAVEGSLFHRPDIGTTALINQRITHMNQLTGGELTLL